MLANDAIEWKRCLREGDDEGIFQMSKRFDVKRELMRMFPTLFQTTGPRTQPDGSVIEESFIDFKNSMSSEDVIDIIRKNRRKIDL